MSLARREKLEQMLAEDPKDPFLHYGLAMDHVSTGEDDQAVARFRLLLEMAPDYVPAYLQAGQALMRIGRPEEARAVFRRGIAVARQKGDTHAAGEMEYFLDGAE